MTRSAPSQQAIEVVRARTHNLKDISCRIPLGQVTVVTGLSGAGKSSLAFDTVYAEAQRRFVESMSTELQRASAVIVPLRSGSGTRIKIIEAFAHRVPVISTSIGCEGLGVRDGEHLLVADTPRAFAAACGTSAAPTRSM